jgi:hypothetical protein
MSIRGIPRVGLSFSYHPPLPSPLQPIEVVSPEVSSVAEVPALAPPPDRIEQLFQELEAKIREYRPRDDLAQVGKGVRTAAELHQGQLRFFAEIRATVESELRREGIRAVRPSLWPPGPGSPPLLEMAVCLKS